MVAEGLGLRPPSGLRAVVSQLESVTARGDLVGDARCPHGAQSAERLRRKDRGKLALLMPSDSHARHQDIEALHATDCGRTKNFQKGLGICWWRREDCGGAFGVSIPSPVGLPMSLLGGV